MGSSVHMQPKSQNTHVPCRPIKSTFCSVSLTGTLRNILEQSLISDPMFPGLVGVTMAIDLSISWLRALSLRAALTFGQRLLLHVAVEAARLPLPFT